jgi:hypothetical protein
MKPKLTPHPWRCFEQKLELTNENALWAVRQTHIVCTSTLPFRDVDRLRPLRTGASGTSIRATI